MRGSGGSKYEDYYLLGLKEDSLLDTVYTYVSQ
jgi:hypothetical protein